MRLEASLLKEASTAGAVEAQKKKKPPQQELLRHKNDIAYVA